MKDPRELDLVKLVHEIVEKEITMPVIKARNFVSGYENPQYKIELQNYKKRLSLLYDELQRRHELYEQL